MKRLFTMFISITMIGLLLTGCGGSGSKEVTAEPAKLAEELAGTASCDTLSAVSQ